MSQLVKRYSLLFTVLVGFSLLFNPLVVKAQSNHPAPPAITDKLILRDFNGSSADVTNTYLSKMFNPNLWQDKELGKSSLSSFDKARSDGVWGVSIREEKRSSDNASYSFIELYWIEYRCPVTLSYFNDSYSFLCNGSSHKWRRVTLYSNYIIANSSTNLDSFSLFNTSKLFSFNGEYSLDPSIKWSVPTLPKARENSFDRDVPNWNDNCGIDVVCHIGNMAGAIKSFFSILLGVFDFSENNLFLKLAKLVLIPKNISELFNFSVISDYFYDSLKPVFVSVDFLKTTISALYPASSSGIAFCHSGHSYYGPGGFNSSGHLYIFESTFFGSTFNPDICSFERMIGGVSSMQKIRVFTGTVLLAVSFLLWHRFIGRVAEERF